MDMQYDAAAQMLQWKREPDTVWNDLLDITDLQGEVVAQTLEAAQAGVQHRQRQVRAKRRQVRRMRRVR